MSILRTIKCDMPQCKAEATEKDTNAGWPGWCIIQGISMLSQENIETFTFGHSNTCMCPEHKQQLVNLITEHMEPK